MGRKRTKIDPVALMNSVDNLSVADMRAIAAEKNRKQSEEAQSPLVAKRRENLDLATAARIYKDIGADEAVEIFTHTNDPRFRELMRTLSDPSYNKMTFQALYHRVGLTSVDIVEACRRYGLDRAVIKLSKRTPEMAENLMEDALPKMEFCPRCDGKGWVPDIDDEDNKAIKRTCPQCEGKCKIRIMGDKESKKMVMDSMGLIKQQPLLAVQNNNFMVPPMEEFVKMKVDKPQIMDVNIEEGETKDENTNSL